jgi:hypothetical protein
VIDILVVRCPGAPVFPRCRRRLRFVGVRLLFFGYCDGPASFFARSLLVGVGKPEVPLDGDRHILINRAGMRFLLLDTEFRQQFEDFVRLYLELTRQLIDSDLQLHK